MVGHHGAGTASPPSITGQTALGGGSRHFGKVMGDHGGCLPIGSITYLGFAGRGEVLLNEESSQGHAEVLVGLAQADLTRLQLLIAALHLLGELVDGIAEGGREVLAQHHHDAPQHVVVKDPVTGTAAALSMSPGTGEGGNMCQDGDALLGDTGGPWLVGAQGHLAPCPSLTCDESADL